MENDQTSGANKPHKAKDGGVGSKVFSTC